MADATATTEQAVATAQAPANMPFGKADPAALAAAAAADPAQVAVNNIPVPTWRPERTLPADLAPPPSKDVLMALADTAEKGKTATDAFSVLPSARPEPAKPDAVKAVLDEANAQVSAQAGNADEYQVASLAEEPRSAFNDPSYVDVATPRQAVAARPAGSDPAAAIGAGVKTTRKEARATARDQKPGPRAMVVAAAPQAARWALTSGDKVATVSSATTAPGYAYNIVHTPPSEVYTAGFQPSNEVADVNRFTGNAVKFMSVARFQTK
jgi:hypothetical protein